MSFFDGMVRKMNSSLCGKENRAAVFEKGACYNLNGITVVDLYGSWLEMGCQYGSLCKDYLCDVLRYIYGKTAESKSKLDSAIDISERLYSHYPVYLQDFYDGIKRGDKSAQGLLAITNHYVNGEWSYDTPTDKGFFARVNRLRYGR